MFNNKSHLWHPILEFTPKYKLQLVHVVVVLHYVQLGIKLLQRVQIIYEGLLTLSRTYVLFVQAVQVVELEH